MNKKNKPEYNEIYYSNYYESHLGDVPYDTEFRKKGFESIADQIVEQFQPKTFLDVGCAFGYLVAALRDRGVKAYGIDVSEYAISQVREDIKEYCRASSGIEQLPKDFPDCYDLIATIEVAEHLYPEDGDMFIRNICKYSNHIIFSSTPDDKDEETHFNVQPANYWVKRFYENGFFNDYNKKPFYISPQCLYFYKESNIEKVIDNYELYFEKLSKSHKEEIKLVKEDREKAQEIMDSQAQELIRVRNDISIIKADREKAQEVMDSQAQELLKLREDISIIKADREKAQEVMDSQAEELTRLRNDISIIKGDREKAQEIMTKQAEEIQVLKVSIFEKQKQYQEVVQSVYWRATKPVRFVFNKIGRM